MVESATKVGRPVLTTALLQIGLFGQCLCEADRAWGYIAGLEPTAFLPEAYPGQIDIVISTALMVLFVINVVLLLTWLFKASRFIGSKAVPDLTFQGGWVIAWWFIPIANFVAPFMVMAEIYNASRAPAAWKTRGPPILAILWWGANLAGLAVACASRFGMSFGFDIPSASVMNTGVTIFGTLRLLFLMMLVALIAHFQKAASASNSKVENVF